MAYNSRFSELSWDEIKELNRFVVEAVKKMDKNNIVIVGDPPPLFYRSINRFLQARQIYWC